MVILRVFANNAAGTDWAVKEGVALSWEGKDAVSCTDSNGNLVLIRNMGDPDACRGEAAHVVWIDEENVLLTKKEWKELTNENQEI